jgi:hypothetical protein
VAERKDALDLHDVTATGSQQMLRVFRELKRELASSEAAIKEEFQRLSRQLVPCKLPDGASRSFWFLLPLHGLAVQLCHGSWLSGLIIPVAEKVADDFYEEAMTSVSSDFEAAWRRRGSLRESADHISCPRRCLCSARCC